MRSLFLTAPHQLAWMEEDTPQPGADEVLVKTTASAISIGTELPQYRGDARTDSPANYPTMTGYENVAEVIATGSHVQNVSIGQRVIGFYGYCSHALIPHRRLIFVPDDITDKQALLAILSCDVAKGIRKLRLKPEEQVLITGCGAIGLLACFLLPAYGVHDVTVLEPIGSRRELALALGAQQAFHPDDRERFSGYFAAGLECSASQSAFALLQHIIQRNGRITILSDGNRDALTLLPDFHHKELTLYGSSDGWDYPAHARWFFERLRHTTVPLDAIFDKEIRAEHIPDTFADLASGVLTAIKVFITDF